MCMTVYNTNILFTSLIQFQERIFDCDSKYFFGSEWLYEYHQIEDETAEKSGTEDEKK